MKILVLFTACSFIAPGFCFIPNDFRVLDDSLPETFDWRSVKASNKLRYTPCYSGFECARFNVPLDWSDLSNPNEVTLAVARLPAKVNESDPLFGGTIVVNPGGPSGSGVDFLRWAGRGIQEIVDGEKHFEILSWDPRGTKYTTPSTACFEDDANRDMYLVQNVAAGSVDDSQMSLNNKWALSQGFGQLCEHSISDVYPDGSNVRQYVTTALVAHDMVDLTDAIEEHRLHTLSQLKTHHNAQHVLESEHIVPLLNYWGYSYGSYLGNTFASMFPGRIGRMILDGIVSAPDYTATGWSTNLNDNDKVWLKFFEWCFEAGPKCALYSHDVKRPNQLAAKLDAFLEHLQNNPLPIVYNDNVYTFTYFLLQTQMHLASYAPYQVWPLLAIGLSALLQGDPTSLLSLTEHPSFKPLLRSHASPAPLFTPLFPHPLDSTSFDPTNNHSTPSLSGYPHTLEASTAILCGDGADITTSTKSNYYNYVQLLKSQSRLIGPVWAHVTLSCHHWPSSQRPSDRNRFTGPWTTRLSQYANDSRASPLLFIGNTADPVTPLRNAVKMAEGHEGARVLVQDSPGHCSGVHIPSGCTWRTVREFFGEGKLPEEERVCAVDWRPWDRE